MQQEQFFVARNGQQEGPISLDEILKRVKAKTLDVSDYLYDEAQNDWVMLMAYPRLSDGLKSLKPPAPPAAAQKASEPKSERQPNEWFVLKGDNKFGPFAYTELIKMLQDKSIFEYDYVWHAGLPAWERVASLSEFAPEAIRGFRENSGQQGLNEVFFRRRHARAEYGASILIHDNRHVYKGRGIEISAGGAGLVIENAVLEPGDKLFLHFKPGDGVPPFNATCEVVSKRYTNVSDKTAPVQYGVRFTHIATHTQQILNDFAIQKVAA